MAAEIEELKRDYEDKLKEVTNHKMTLQTGHSDKHNDFKDKHYKDKDGKVPDQGGIKCANRRTRFIDSEGSHR